MELSVEESCRPLNNQLQHLLVHTDNCRYNKLQIAGHLVSAQLCLENGGRRRENRPTKKGNLTLLQMTHQSDLKLSTGSESSSIEAAWKQSAASASLPSCL
uniref:Uncharacterized protein n=1 Tax=Zea mays TaxID=4577 RepID=C4J029_MAIZE|nr:unknown [Zea mays]